MTSRPEAEIEIAQRHVREGAERVARMVQIIDEMDRHNHPKTAATGRSLLETMRVTLDMAKRHLIRLESNSEQKEGLAGTVGRSRPLDGVW